MFAAASSSPSDAVRSLNALDVESLLLPVLIQLAVILTVARIAGVLFRRMGQPTVVGEIIAGVLLGPSLFGALFPETFGLIFKPHLHGVPDDLARAFFPKIFTVLAQLGLIFLLFIVGLEFDYKHLKVKGPAAFWVMFIGTTLPFGLGAGLAPLIHPHLEAHARTGESVPLLGLTLFLGTALSITALPILGRMMIELGVQRTRLAAVVISAAAIGDAVGWILLATVAALTQAQFSWSSLALMAGATVAFFFFMQFVLRPLAVRYFQKALDANNGELSLTSLAVLLVLLLLCATATNVIGIFAIFGAFLFGAVMSDQDQFRQAVLNRLRDFITAFFLPIFFTYTGLRTEIGTLDDSTKWLIAAIVIAAAFAGKLIGCTIAARLNGFPSREAAIVGVMMNTRALMELIVINIGYEIGVIPKSLFCILVMMAILSTIMTAPIVLRLRHGTELEEPIARSGFLTR